MASNETPNMAEPSNTPRMVRSFTRMDSPSQEQIPRTRSKTVPGIATPEPVDSSSLPLPSSPGEEGADVFEKPVSAVSGDENDIEELEPSILQPDNLPARFDELPIELISLSDRFVESLSAKIYSTPPSIEQLSELFQDFYIRAASHISTHISTLASRINRDTSPSSDSGQTKPQPKRAFSSKSLQNYGKKDTSTAPAKEQQMLTATEVAERRKARKLLRYKQQVLEEAVERRTCESVYEKIWRHRSTLDEVRDEKLRSRTAALSLVGIQMKDLGIEMPTSREGKPVDAAELLTDARDSIMQMNGEKSPLGKLRHLTAAHKAIVDVLTNLFPSSSSADEILPTLIYTLITSPQDVNIISNLLFIQRFRAATKIDGEAAYCLTNLEAAISFLENVDMATLGADELRSNSQTTVKRDMTLLDPLAMENTDPIQESPIPPASDPHMEDQASLSRPSALSPSPQQRLSSIFQPPAKALGAANDIVRNTADQGIKNIGNTLDNSFNFLFGRLKEVQMNQGDASDGKVGIVPKTLDDARRLVNPPTVPSDEDASVNEYNILKEQSTASTSNEPRPKLDDRLAGTVGVRNSSGDGSLANPKPKVDAKGSGETRPGTDSTAAPSPSVFQTSSNAFGSVKNFGTTINPLNRIPGVIRGFGRNTPEQAVSGASPAVSDEKPKPPPSLKVKGSGDVLREGNKQTPSLAQLPITKFMEMDDASELKVGDIPELLQDYKRLASMLYEAET